MHETLSSPHNPLLKDVRKAVSLGGLTSEGWCVAEGPHLAAEAERSRCRIARLLGTREVLLPFKDRQHCVELPEKLLVSLAATESPQGLIALVVPPVGTPDQLFSAPALVLVLDGLQDPGNAGAIVRAAEAFGATGVIFLKGTVSPFNPKTLRASAGSLSAFPSCTAWTAAEALDACRSTASISTPLCAARSGAGRPSRVSTCARRCALIIGSEGRGVSDRLARRRPSTCAFPPSAWSR